MQNWPPNPYFNMKAMDSSSMFFGRTQLLRKFYVAIANRQSVSLEGPRRIGKTSFLRCASLPEVQQSFAFNGSQYLFVYLNLREYLRKTCEDFLLAVCKALIADGPELPELQLQAGRDSADEFSRILNIITGRGFFPVLLLDAFDNVTRNEHFDAEFLAFLRAKATNGQISYVTASVAPLVDVSHRDIVDSPFFNIFYNYELGPLAPEEARDLITLPAEKVGLPFTASETALIARMAGRHPFFIQRVCHSIFEEKLSHNNCEEQRLKKLVYEDLQPHFTDIWERLIEDQRRMLQEEAQKHESQNRELPELSESELFCQFVRLTCGAAIFEMTPDELEKALDIIDDARALGTSNLRLMNLVARRLENTIVPSVVERGMVIRSILQEAFERLRGPQIRTDTDPALQSYNILYYRYFKNHLKNGQIAARIGFSSRQYFRYRNKAIAELLNVLLEMENASDRAG